MICADLHVYTGSQSRRIRKASTVFAVKPTDVNQTQRSRIVFSIAKARLVDAGRQVSDLRQCAWQSDDFRGCLMIRDIKRFQADTDSALHETRVINENDYLPRIHYMGECNRSCWPPLIGH